MSRYDVYVTPQALREIKELPGNMRQRVKRAISKLAQDPYPSQSKTLDFLDGTTYSLRRIRIDKWRILYGVSVSANAVDVLAVRKRPPYDYGDLESLISELI